MTRYGDQRNFVTNPCFEELKQAVAEMIRKETAALTQLARGGNTNEINVQAGIVEGLERVRLRLANFEKTLTQTPQKDRGAGFMVASHATE